MTYRFNRSVGFHATGEHTCRYSRTRGAWLAEVTFRINYDLALSTERPPDDVIAGELKFLPKRFDNASELSLIIGQVDQRLIEILFALP